MTVVRDILLRAIKMAFNVPSDRVQNDVLRYALDSYNHYGQLIWNEWKWDNAKLNDKVYTPDEEGIITLDADVEAVRAIYAGDLTSNNGSVLPLDDVHRVGGKAPALTEQTYQYMSDDDSGQRRIKVTEPDQTYVVLALKRFVEATVEADYDEDDPDATPTDYRVAKWLLDRAKPAIVASVADAMRMMRGLPPTGQGQSAVQSALSREESIQAKDHRVVPQFPIYDEVGNWY